MAITIEFKDKYVYFGGASGLHTQGEAYAETYDITGPPLLRRQRFIYSHVVCSGRAS